MKPCYVYSQLHKGLLIGIKTSAQSFTYQILGHSSNCESKNHYHTIEAALTAGVAEAEKVFHWESGFDAGCRGKAIPTTATQDWITGWNDAFNDGVEADEVQRMKASMQAQANRLGRGEPLSEADALAEFERLIERGFSDDEIWSIVHWSQVKVGKQLSRVRLR